MDDKNVNPTVPPVAPQASSVNQPVAPKVDTSEWESKLKALEKEKEELAQLNQTLYGVVEFVAQDEELKEKFSTKWSAKNNPQPISTEKKDVTAEKVSELESKISSIEAKERAEIISSFEDSVGIAGLSEEEKAKARSLIGSKISEWGGRVDKVPTANLATILKDAFTAVNPDAATKSAEMSGAAKMYNNAVGSFGSMPSYRINSDGEKTFSPGQAEYLSKLGIDVEKAKKYAKPS